MLFVSYVRRFGMLGDESVPPADSILASLAKHLEAKLSYGEKPAPAVTLLSRTWFGFNVKLIKHHRFLKAKQISWDCWIVIAPLPPCKRMLSCLVQLWLFKHCDRGGVSPEDVWGFFWCSGLCRSCSDDFFGPRLSPFETVHQCRRLKCSMELCWSMSGCSSWTFSSGAGAPGPALLPVKSHWWKVERRASHITTWPQQRHHVSKKSWHFDLFLKTKTFFLDFLEDWTFFSLVLPN